MITVGRYGLEIYAGVFLNNNAYLRLKRHGHVIC